MSEQSAKEIDNKSNYAETLNIYLMKTIRTVKNQALLTESQNRISNDHLFMYTPPSFGGKDSIKDEQK